MSIGPSTWSMGNLSEVNDSSSPRNHQVLLGLSYGWNFLNGAGIVDGLIFCRQSQSLWVHVWHCHACSSADIHYGTYCLSIPLLLWFLTLGGSGCVVVPFRVKNGTVSYSLHSDQLWASVLIMTTHSCYNHKRRKGTASFSGALILFHSSNLHPHGLLLS